MKNKGNIILCLITLMGVIHFPVQAQQKNGAHNPVQAKEVTSSHGPSGVVRAIIQDRKGNIWIASWEGILRYDGKCFTNITSKVSSAHFFSILEDRKGNFWFASIGSGVYYYNGESFRNYTTKDGLADNDVTAIYEDKAGNTWFSTGSGVSRYDGKSFRNYTMKEMMPENDAHWMMEEKTRSFWFDSDGEASIYGENRFTKFTHNGKPFTNVRAIIEDKRGNIWLGGADGLWRYDHNMFINLTRNFVGSIYEDKEGNIWTGSENADHKSWTLTCYDEKSLLNKRPAVTKIKSIEVGMICDIFEANDGGIWFGTGDGVYRYDGNVITDFKGQKNEAFKLKGLLPN